MELLESERHKEHLDRLCAKGLGSGELSTPGIPKPTPGRLLLLLTRDFVPVTLQRRWHPLTEDWPVIALRDCSVAAKSGPPSRMGITNAVAGWRRLHAAAK